MSVYGTGLQMLASPPPLLSDRNSFSSSPFFERKSDFLSAVVWWAIPPDTGTRVTCRAGRGIGTPFRSVYN